MKGDELHVSDEDTATVRAPRAADGMPRHYARGTGGAYIVVVASRGTMACREMPRDSSFAGWLTKVLRGRRVIGSGAYGTGDMTLTQAANDSRGEIVTRTWSARDAAGLVRDDDFEAERRLEGEIGYGLAAGRRRLVIATSIRRGRHCRPRSNAAPRAGASEPHADSPAAAHPMAAGGGRGTVLAEIAAFAVIRDPGSTG